MNVRTAVRRWRRFPVWGEGRFGDHTLLVKAPPQIPTHMSVTMRRERGPPRLAPWNHRMRIRYVPTFVYVDVGGQLGSHGERKPQREE